LVRCSAIREIALRLTDTDEIDVVTRIQCYTQVVEQVDAAVRVYPDLGPFLIEMIGS
jgi:hypothetical protein